jgi:hypothetical protein
VIRPYALQLLFEVVTLSQLFREEVIQQQQRSIAVLVRQLLESKQTVHSQSLALQPERLLCEFVRQHLCQKRLQD